MALPIPSPQAAPSLKAHVVASTSNRSCSTSTSSRPMHNATSRRLTSFVTFLALFLSQEGQAFQTTSRRPHRHQTHNGNINVDLHNNHRLLPTRLSNNNNNRGRRTNKTAVYYSSGTADLPLSSDNNSRRKSFGDRMRNISLKREQVERQDRTTSQQQSTSTTTSSSSINPHKPPFVAEAVSLAAYKALVADEQECYVVVRFYAKWCRACKAVENPFYRLARSMPGVKFVEVPVLEENANLHQGLGVPALPFAHVYSPTSGLVEELRMAKKDFGTFQEVVTTYRNGECTDLEMDAETGMFLSPYLLATKKRGDSIIISGGVN